MKSSVLGVIGGLGPLATARFMELVVEMTDAKREQDNVDMIVYNFPSIPDRTGYILGRNMTNPFHGLLSVARELSRQNVGQIAIPCMTAHYFYEELQQCVPTPIIHGIRETVKHLRSSGVKSVGLMASEGTVVSGLFTNEMEHAGIRTIVPSNAGQQDINHLIYQNIKEGIPPEMDRFQAVEQALRNGGAEVIILGCTELSLIKRDVEIGGGFLDAMEVLAQQSVLRCGKTLKEKYGNLITKG